MNLVKKKFRNTKTKFMNQRNKIKIFSLKLINQVLSFLNLNEYLLLEDIINY